jgi:hypothetical protein
MKNKYTRGETVSFEIDGEILVGKVFIIDFRNANEGKYFGFDSVGYTYDIMVKSKDTLYKHIPEYIVTKVEK